MSLDITTVYKKYGEMAAAAKSLQSCPTLCYPIDGSPPGSSVHEIFINDGSQIIHCWIDVTYKQVLEIRMIYV